jgi:hypothetical protein
VGAQEVDYNSATGFCQQIGAQLVSITDADENSFVWQICGTWNTDALYPALTRRKTCWLGLTEKPATGDKNTPGASQHWVWADGNPMTAYANWKTWVHSDPAHGDNEPNNGGRGWKARTVDERHAVFNLLAGGMAGRWYDMPASYKALPVCERAAVPIPCR